jgi:hypothetical protein
MTNSTSINCATCHAEFSHTRVGRGRVPTYCSDQCRNDGFLKARELRLARRPECSVEWCDEKARSTSTPLCEMHYYRVRRHGSTNGSHGAHRIANGQCHQCATPLPRKRLFCSTLCMKRNRLGMTFGRVQCAVCIIDLPAERRSDSLYCTLSCQRVAERAKRYGVPVQDLLRMLQDAQGCAICGDSNAELVVDHCHTTLNVRGLLCSNCNIGIGMFRDDPSRLQGAIAYLQASK